jgi:hypothetical protein
MAPVSNATPNAPRDSLDSVAQLRRILGTEVADQVANACNFISMQGLIRNDKRLVHLFRDTARLFKAVAADAS